MDRDKVLALERLIVQKGMKYTNEQTPLLKNESTR